LNCNFPCKLLQIPATPTCTDVNGAADGADPFTCGPGFRLKDNVGSTSITGPSDPNGQNKCCEKVSVEECTEKHDKWAAMTCMHSTVLDVH
jgi:hypothetical protein